MKLTHFSPLIAISSSQDGEKRARLIRERAMQLLANPGAVGCVTEAALGAEGEEMAQDAQALLSATLDEARMALENDVPEGAVLIDAITSSLTALDAAEPFAAVTRLSLARTYASAGLVPPSFAILTDGPAADDIDAEMPDLDTLLGPILRELGDTPAQAHAALSEMMAGLPVEPAVALVSMIVARPGIVEARLGLYWLLDPRAELRLAAATALLSRAGAGAMPTELAVLLPTIRKWLPDDGARAAVDATIRRQMRDGHAWPATNTVTIHSAAASLPDGVGAQSLIAAVQNGSRRGVAMMMLKRGHGVKDAFILPCTSATEQKRLLASVLDEIETHELPAEALTAALSRGLGEGLTLGRLPAPGMVDMAEIWGPEALLPSAANAEDVLAAIGTSDAIANLSQARLRDLVQSSGEWLDHFEHLDSWFEDTGDLRVAIGRARTETGRETAVWKHLENRRDWWARTFATSAAVMQACDDAVWLSFAAAAQALIDGKSLKRLPIMVDIVAMTLEAWRARLDEEQGSHGVTAVDGVDEMLARAGISPAFLHGYLVAMTVSPRTPSPEAWIGGLLGGIEFAGDGAFERVFEVVVSRAHMIDEDAANSEAMSRVLAAMDAEDVTDWAAGFDALVSAARRSWPTRAMSADDKRLLQALSKVASGSDDPVLLSLLPAWIAMRHAMRE